MQPSTLQGLLALAKNKILLCRREAYNKINCYTIRCSKFQTTVKKYKLWGYRALKNTVLHKL